MLQHLAYRIDRRESSSAPDGAEQSRPCDRARAFNDHFEGRHPTLEVRSFPLSLVVEDWRQYRHNC